MNDADRRARDPILLKYIGDLVGDYDALHLQTSNLTKRIHRSLERALLINGEISNLLRRSQNTIDFARKPYPNELYARLVELVTWIRTDAV